MDTNHDRKESNGLRSEGAAAAGTGLPQWRQLLSEYEERYLKLRRYFQTRAAYKRGEPLHALSREERSARGYMNPWPFNLYESGMAATPALFVLKIVDFFDPPSRASSYDATLSQFWQEVAAIFPSIDEFFAPLYVPLTLSMIVWVVVRGTLERADRTPSKKQVVRDAYLYFDGAHGLLPQALANIAIIVLLILSSRSLELLFVEIFCFVVLMFFSFYQIWLQHGRIPEFLFTVLGIPDEKCRWWTLFRKKTPAEKRWDRYTWWFYIGGGCVVIGNFVLLQALVLGVAVSLVLLRNAF